LKGPIQSVEVSYLLHETEDPEKVGRAVKRAFSLTVQPEVEQLRGHFGNSIARVSVHLTGAEAAAAFEGMLAGLRPATRRELGTDATPSLDDHSALVLRFDKQRLVGGELVVGSKEPIRIRVKPRAFLMKGGAREFYARLFGGTER
jgi:RNA binding exosome subunit